MSKKSTAILVFIVATLNFVQIPRLIGQSLDLRQSEILYRAPFVLELPELGDFKMTRLAASVPMAHIRTLRFRVLKPFNEQIQQNKIFTRLNGEAITTLQIIKSDLQGLVVTCDLAAKPGFGVISGKNVVEISAEDRSRRVYYASYILMVGGAGVNSASDTQASPLNATLEKIPVAAGDDQAAPEIRLNQETLLRQGQANAQIHGTVADLASEIKSLKINGQAVALASCQKGDSGGLPQQLKNAGSQAALCLAARELVLSNSPDVAQTKTPKFVYSFAQPIRVDRIPTVIIEAADRAGNLTRLILPVRGAREATNASFKFTGRKYALIVGVSQYQYIGDGLNNLKYADVDAQKLRDFFASPAGGNFPTDNIRFLINQNATLDSVEEGLQFLKKAEPDDLVMIFFAGHGAPDPFNPRNLYLLLHDTKISDLERTGFAMAELQRFLDSEVRAKRVIVFVDACHSGGLSGKKLASRAGKSENNLINLYASGLYRETGRAVLTSSDVDEVSFEDQRWGGGHGVFTRALLEGLNGRADVNGDKYVTASELFSFVSDRVGQETNFQQNPRPLAGTNGAITLATTARQIK